MYIIIQENPLKVVTFEAKTDLAACLGIHRNTIKNKFDLKECWKSEKGMVYRSTEHTERRKGGNTDNQTVKLRKKNREIPCKNPKLNISSLD